MDLMLVQCYRCDCINITEIDRGRHMDRQTDRQHTLSTMIVASIIIISLITEMAQANCVLIC